MKVAIINDTHWGVRNDSTHFLAYFEKFYSEKFFPELVSRGITRILHLGDLVDRRKYININTANKLRTIFFEEAERLGMEIDVTIGNHDTYFKNTNEVNSLSELTRGYNYVRLYTRATEIEIDGRLILLIPWICDDNREHTIEMINKTKAIVAMGHLELSGFQMYKGVPQHHGDDPSMFGSFDVVLSGHYHHRSTSGNISYLGAPCEYTWSDHNDDRGFHIFDTDTLELEFVKNPFTMFKKAFYDDINMSEEELMELQFEDCANSIVKLVVRNKNNPHLFDKFVDAIEKAKPYDLQIVEDHMNLNLEDDMEIVSEAESTLDIFKKYIRQLAIPENKQHNLEKTIIELYDEATSLS